MGRVRGPKAAPSGARSDRVSPLSAGTKEVDASAQHPSAASEAWKAQGRGAVRQEPASEAGVLQASWLRGWAEVAPAAVADRALLSSLVTAYSEPQRRYHTTQHLTEVLSLFDRLRENAVRPGEVEVALWFHDAVYDIEAHDNERRSADWAREAVLGASGTPEGAKRIESLVMATQHSAPPGTPDETLIVDVDLAILGAAPKRFAEYEAQVRAEYAQVPDAEFRLGRRRVLEAFLARPYIYGTPALQRAFEKSARENLRRAVDALSVSLADADGG